MLQVRCPHSVLTTLQMKDSLRMYNSLVERCFMDCINDFTTRSLSSKEVRGRQRARNKEAAPAGAPSSCALPDGREAWTRGRGRCPTGAVH